MMNKYIYLPIEIEKRELESKCILASKLVQNGYDVIIGQQWEIFYQIQNLPKGIILFKGYSKIYLPIIKLAHLCGHKILLHDEELFIQFPNESFTNSLDEKLKQYYNAILTSGNEEFNILSNRGFERLIKWGNPRSELLGKIGKEIYKNKIEQIKNKYSEYILINTNFGVINTLWNDSDLARNAAIQSGHIDPNNKEHLDEWDKLVNEEKNNWEIIKKLIYLIDRQIKIIIRPHPSENINRWINEYANYSNVNIIRDGNHVPWTSAAKLLLQFNCLTGIEAFILNTPSYTINTNTNTNTNTKYYSDFKVSNYVKVLDSIEDAVNLIHNKFQIKNNIENSKLDSIKELTWNFNSKKACSDIFVEIANNLINETENFNFDKLKYNKPVSQLMSKCDIDLKFFMETYANIHTIINDNNEFSIKELTKSLFHLNKKLEQNNTLNKLDDVDKMMDQGKIKEAYAIIKSCEVGNKYDIQIIYKLANFYLKISDEYNALKYYLLLETFLPSSIDIKIKICKSGYNINPRLVLNKIKELNILTANKSSINFDVYTQLIEYYGWSSRKMAGLSQHHSQNIEKLPFEFIQTYADGYFDIAKKIWTDLNLRNIDTYEKIALATFAAKGLYAIKSFLPILRKELDKTVWASTWLPDEKPQYYLNKKAIFEFDHSISKEKADNIVLLSCDLVYFRKFAISLIKSIVKTGYNHNIIVHLMAENEDKNSFLYLIKLLNNDLNIDIDYIFEDISAISSISKKRIYYHIRRFTVVNFLLNRYNIPVLMLDVDALVRNDLSIIFKNNCMCDIAFRARPGRLHLWNQFNASVILFNSTESSKIFISLIDNYLSSSWINNELRWGSDQLSMFLVYNYMSKEKISIEINLFDEFTVDYNYDDNGIVWQNSGVIKFFDLSFYKDNDNLKIKKFIDYSNSLN